jgi:LPXTG-motif cell wall-anchored protein
MPGGDIRNCNDEVLGGTIGGPGNPGGPNTGPDVLGTGPAERPNTAGRILPFTGSSIIAYLLLGFELMAAGLLMLRARNRRR